MYKMKTLVVSNIPLETDSFKLLFYLQPLSGSFDIFSVICKMLWKATTQYTLRL